MADVSHSYGGDFDLSATGGLLVVSGDAETTQHVIKRIITAPGAYIWHLSYGAGAGQFVGQPMNELAIRNAIRSQIFAEQTVSQVPEPEITLIFADDGSVTADIIYTDAVTGKPAVAQLTLGN